MVVKVTLYVPEKGDCFSHVTRTACIFCNSCLVDLICPIKGIVLDTMP